MIVDCVYRYARDGEMFESTFDTEQKQIKGAHLIKITGDYASSTRFYTSNYAECSHPISKGELYRALVDSGGGLAAINYDEIGILILYPMYYKIFLRLDYSVCDTLWYNFKTEVVAPIFRVGPVRTRIHQVETAQKVAFAYATKLTDTKLCLFTKDGLKIISGELSEFKIQDFKLYKRLVYQGNPNTICICVSGDEYRILCYGESEDIIEVKEIDDVLK